MRRVCSFPFPDAVPHSTHHRSAAPGKGYSIFAGKDASRALGMSSLKAEDANADYSTLDDKQMKVLDDWVSAQQVASELSGEGRAERCSL